MRLEIQVLMKAKTIVFMTDKKPRRVVFDEEKRELR